MNVYKKPGTAISAVRNGSGNEAAYIYSMIIDGVTHAVPVNISAQAQVAKNGVSRVLVKVVMSVPRNAAAMTNLSTSLLVQGKGTEDLTIHAVLTAGPMFQGLLSQDAALQYPAKLALQELVGSLVAILAGKDSVDVTVANSMQPLTNGLRGLWPLDVENGTYGAAT